MHEMGHLLGIDHAERGLMQDELAAGVRRIPQQSDLAMMLALEQSVGKRRNWRAVDGFFSELEHR